MEVKNIKDKKWFILTYYTDIDSSSLVGGLRPYKLLDYLGEKGIDATIISRQNSRGNEIVILEKKVPKIINKVLRLMPPDRFVFWGKKVATFLKSKNNFVLFSTSPPNGIHAAGLLLKMMHKDFFWIIDYRDPFLLNDFYKPLFIKHSFNKWYEKKIFKKADLIILNTDSNNKSHQEAYPYAKEKMLAVRNGFDDIIANEFIDDHTFIYAGGTSKGLASDRVVELLQKINDLGFSMTCDFFGEHDKIVDNCLFTDYKGVISPEEVPQLLKNYKFGFIFLPLPFLGGGRIAQKYYDYIGSGVIPVIINPSKELEDLVKQFKTGICIYPDSDPADIILATKSASFNLTEKEQAQFSRNGQFDKLSSVLNL